MVDVEELILDLTKKFEKELRESVIDFVLEDYKRVLSSVVEEIKVINKSGVDERAKQSEQVVAEICNECTEGNEVSKHICDMCGCEIESDSECDSDDEVLTEEQKKNIVKALSSTFGSSEVEEVIEKTESKKEEFGNILGGRKPTGGRYGRRNFTERLLPPP